MSKIKVKNSPQKEENLFGNQFNRINSYFKMAGRKMKSK